MSPPLIPGPWHVAWKDVPDPKPNDPNRTKKLAFEEVGGGPIDVWTGRPHLSYEAAVALAATDGFAGIGVTLSPDHDLFCLDFDGCRDPATGVLQPEAEAFVKRVRSRTEVSPSKTGVKIFFRGSKAPTGKPKEKWPAPWTRPPDVRKDPGVEFFARGGFCTITGETLPGCEDVRTIPDDEFASILAGLRPRQPATTATPSAATAGGNAARDVREALKALAAIPGAAADVYESSAGPSWLGVGMALHSVSPELLPAWTEWSRRSDKFVEGECERKWAGFGARSGGLTLASLVMWATRPQDAGGFEVLGDAGLDARPDGAWLIEGVLPVDVSATLYGRRGTYKSFVALDWGLSVQTGTDWLGREVRQGRFVYVAAEGWGGIKKRVRAWKKAHGFVGDTGALWVKGRSLQTDAAVERLVADVRSRTDGGGPVAIIELDTLNRLLPGIEENSPEAMGRAVGIADRLREAFSGATAVWVHHSGWDDQHERGHSSLGDDLDVVVHADRDLAPMTVELVCEKQKDADEGPPIRVAASVVEVGTDAEGRPITSLAIAEAVGGSGPGAPPNETEAAVLAALAGTMTPDAWFGACVAAGVKVRRKVIGRRTFNNARAGLVRKGRVAGDLEHGFTATPTPEAGSQIAR